MEPAAAIALVLLVISEILPFTPLKSNGIVQEVLRVLVGLFPRSGRGR